MASDRPSYEKLLCQVWSSYLAWFSRYGPAKAKSLKPCNFCSSQPIFFKPKTVLGLLMVYLWFEFQVIWLTQSWDIAVFPYFSNFKPWKHPSNVGAPIRKYNQKIPSCIHFISVAEIFKFVLSTTLKIELKCEKIVFFQLKYSQNTKYSMNEWNMSEFVRILLFSSDPPKNVNFIWKLRNLTKRVCPGEIGETAPE